MVEELIGLRQLHDLAQVHDGDAVADVAHDREVVGDEDDRQPQLALQLGEQVDDLRLDRDVEGRDGLVGHHELRLQGDGARDADALALAAGELVREAVVVLGVQPDAIHQLLHELLALVVVALEAMDDERLADDRAHRLARVQRRVGVLEDHLHVAPQRLELGARRVRDVVALVDDLAAGGLQQPRQQPRGGRLAAARLPHEAEGLALEDVEGDAVDGAHGADLLLQDDPLAQREVLLEVMDLDELGGAVGAHGVASSDSVWVPSTPGTTSVPAGARTSPTASRSTTSSGTSTCVIA